MRSHVRLRILVAGGLWAAVLACTPVPLDDPTCTGAAVTGKLVDVFVSDKGDVNRPRQASGLTVEALLPLSGNRGFVHCPGSATDGAFMIPAVPSGLYVLHVNSSFVYTSEHSIDLSRPFLGRPDQVRASAGTNLTLNLGGLDPWDANHDLLELYSSNAGAAVYAPEQGATSGAPMTGATSLSTSFGYAALGQPLVDASKGDTLFVTQLAGRPASNGLTASVLIKALSLSTFTLSDGQANTLSGTFIDLPTTNAFSINWQRSAFESQRQAVSPDALSNLQELVLSVIPEGQTRGEFTSTPDLLLLVPPSGPANLTAGGQFGNPFPASFAVVADVLSSFEVDKTFQGGTEKLIANIVVRDLAKNMNGITVSPLAVPVVAPRINGKDALVDEVGVGETPTLAWTRPSPGPDRVSVRIERLVSTAGVLTHEFVGSLITTTETSLTIPSGNLKTGESYFFFIDADVSIGADFTHTPFVAPFPSGTATVVTGTFTP